MDELVERSGDISLYTTDTISTDSWINKNRIYYDDDFKEERTIPESTHEFINGGDESSANG